MKLAFEVPDDKVVELVMERLKAATAPAVSSNIAFPAIGTHWHGHGGIFAGIIRGRDGGKDCALILGPQLPESNWKDAQKKAAAVSVDGHDDFRLPFRKEQALLFANVADQFQERWYWSCERHADFDGYAWMQYFEDGNQGYDDVDDEFLACAVRVIPLQ